MLYEKINIRGVYFNNVNMDEALLVCRELIESGEGGVVHTPNAEIVQLCVEKPEYYTLINSAQLIIPDGSGVILASKILGTPLKKGRVAGVELGQNLCRYAAEYGRGVFLLGGRPGIAEMASERLRGLYPGLRVVGTHDGYFDDDAPVIEQINQSGASIVFVCLSVPKQEKWMAAHRGELKGKLLCGLGGSMDIYSGMTKRAPKIFRALGLEWLYRLIQEPKRAGRMVKLPKFVLGSVCANFGRK